MRTLPHDPFNRSRLPAEFAHEKRVELVGRVAEDLLAGRLPDAEARLFVAGGMLARLENGGNLERDYWQITRQHSHTTPQVVWRDLKRRRHRG